MVQKPSPKYINPETTRTDNKLSDIIQAKIEQATKTLKKELSEELNRDLLANKRKNMATDRTKNQETAISNGQGDDLSPRVQELRRRQRVVIGMGGETRGGDGGIHFPQNLVKLTIFCSFQPLFGKFWSSSPPELTRNLRAWVPGS